MELPNFITILAGIFKDSPVAHFLSLWENVIFSFIIICVLSLTAYLVLRKASLIPGRMQNALEVSAGAIDDFICGILGPKGRKYTPFIGTLFIYILFMNLAGIIPFMKSPTSSWSTTLALALCVFAYVQYTALKEQGIKGYIDHMMGRPRGFCSCFRGGRTKTATLQQYVPEGDRRVLTRPLDISSSSDIVASVIYNLFYMDRH